MCLGQLYLLQFSPQILIFKPLEKTHSNTSTTSIHIKHSYDITWLGKNLAIILMCQQQQGHLIRSKSIKNKLVASSEFSGPGTRLTVPKLIEWLSWSTTVSRIPTPTDTEWVIICKWSHVRPSILPSAPTISRLGSMFLYHLCLNGSGKFKRFFNKHC